MKSVVPFAASGRGAHVPPVGALTFVGRHSFILLPCHHLVANKHPSLLSWISSRVFVKKAAGEFPSPSVPFHPPIIRSLTALSTTAAAAMSSNGPMSKIPATEKTISATLSWRLSVAGKVVETYTGMPDPGTTLKIKPPRSVRRGSASRKPRKRRWRSLWVFHCPPKLPPRPTPI